MSARSRFWCLCIAFLLPLIPIHPATNVQAVGRAPITAANTGEVRQLARIGRGATNDLAWSPDRKMLVVASTTGLWLYKVDNPKDEPRLISSDAEEFTAVAFHPNGKTIAVSTNQGLQFWDSVEGKPLGALFGTPKGNLAFSPDGKLLAMSDKQSIELWDASTKQLVGQPFGEGACNVAFSADGKLLACGWGSIAIWDIASRTKIATLEDKTKAFDGAHSVAFNADGTRLAAMDYERVIVWEVKTGRQVESIATGIYGAGLVEFDPKGTLLVTKSVGDWPNSVVQLRNVRTKTNLITLSLGVTGDFEDLSFSPDGAILASYRAFKGGSIMFWWDIKTMALIFHRSALPSGFTRFREDGSISFLKSYPDVVLSEAKAGKERVLLTVPTSNLATFSPDETRVAISYPDGSIRMFDARTGNKLLTAFSGRGEASDLLFSADGKQLVVEVYTRAQTYAVILDAQTGEQLAKLEDDMSFINSMAFSPDGKHFVTLSDDGAVRLWEMQAGKLLFSLPVRAKRPMGEVGFNADGSRIAFAGPNAGQLWDAQTGKELAQFDPPENEFVHSSDAIFSPDGKRTVFTYSDHMQIHDAETGTQLAKFSTGKRYISAIFSPDSAQVLSFHDNVVQTWDAQTGKKLLEWKAPSEIDLWRFSQDKSFLITATKAGTLLLWNPKTGALLAELKGHAGDLFDIAFSPDNTIMATSSDDGTIRLWGVPN
jgi:WD40 repeat protein